MQRLRSVLYMSGANERALEKGKQIPADALILDLEDAVAPAAKDEARERACAAASSGEYGSRVVTIRVNSSDTIWHEADVRAAAAARPDAIVVPKVSSVEQVHAAERAIEGFDSASETRIWAMLETPRAVLHAEEIASCSERLTVLVMGTNDLAKELQAEPAAARSPLLASLSLCVLAARAAGKMLLDGVFNDVRDPEGFEVECAQGRQLGFDGKTLIHPGQVEICNRVFSPSPEDIEHAHRVIEAFEEAERSGAGAVLLDGRLIESLHVESARRVLSLAEFEA